MKSREVMRMLVDAGGVRVSGKGDHHSFVFPDGRKCSIPHGGRQNEVSPGMLAKVNRFLRGA